MDMVNKAFIEIMIEGDANYRGFQYPIPTYSITRDFDWSETENNKLLFEMTSKYGTPYFSNYINSDMEPSDVRSMCCRLRLDLRELRKKSGGFFGSGESTGSIGVVTINLPRIAYLATDKADFYRRLDKMMDISARSLKVKRDVITKLLEEGLYPYTKRYLGTFSNHFSTIGLVGMNEAGLNAKWLRKDLTNVETQEFAKEVLNHMRERLSDYQEQYGDLYNLEATPAESTSYRLAKHDKAQFPDIITASENDNIPYYTNSSHLPVGYTADIFSALDVQDELKRCILRARYSTRSSAKNFPTGNPLQNLSEPSRKTINCRITPSRRRTASAKSTAISRANTSSAPNADNPPKFTAVSPATIVPYRTGTTANCKSSRKGKLTTSQTLRITA